MAVIHAALMSWNLRPVHVFPTLAYTAEFLGNLV